MNVKNNWMGVGRITNDLEVKMTESGKKVVNFSIAINDGTKDKPHTTFIPAEAWEGTAETIARYFRKGDQIIACGRLAVRKYQDRGENRNRVNVIIESFEWGEKKKEEKAEYGDYSAKTTMYTKDLAGSGFDDPWNV